MNTIQLRSGAESLTLQFHGRTRPAAQDYWDANWLHCTAEVVTVACRKSVDWQLRNEDLARFLELLERLEGPAPGVALLDTLDGWLDVEISRDGHGELEARCQLEDENRNGSEFSLRLVEDDLPKLTAQIRDVLERFPVVGEKG